MLVIGQAVPDIRGTPCLADMLVGMPWPVCGSGEVLEDAAEQAVSTATAPRTTASAARCGLVPGGRPSEAFSTWPSWLTVGVAR